MHTKSNSFKKVISLFFIMIASIILVEAFTLVRGYAESPTSPSARMVTSASYADPDPYYGTKEYWNEKYGPHEDKYLPANVAAGTILSGTYFVGQDITINVTTANTPGLIISGSVDLFFEDGATLTINGFESANGTASAPAIRLVSKNALSIDGRGSLNVTGGGVNVSASHVSGQDATEPHMEQPKGYELHHGYNGSGGNGSGGVAAVIGTDGGNGGQGGQRISKELVSFFDSFSAETMPNGNNGSNGIASASAGILLMSGLVSVNLTPGDIIKSGTPRAGNGSGTEKWTVREGFFTDDRIYAGSNGGGGQGGYGFIGAIIGSGGSGGSGGGAGGAGGRDYTTNDFDDLYANGGGGGAGCGSLDTKGGGADTKKYYWYNYAAAPGEDFLAQVRTVIANGGTYQGGGSIPDAHGGKGGNGGLSDFSGDAGKVFVVPGILDSPLYRATSIWEGKESSRYLVYPQGDCDLVLYNSLSEDRYIFPFKSGEATTPDFDVIYRPTGEKLDKSYFDIEWVDNDKPGMAQLIIKGKELSTTLPTIGKSMSIGHGELDVSFESASTFTATGISCHSKNYDAQEFSPTVNDPHFYFGESGEEITDVTINDVIFHYSKFDESTQSYEPIQGVPKDVGGYRAYLTFSKEEYKDYFCTLDGADILKFEIRKTDLSISGTSEGFTLTKTYDKTTAVDLATLSGSVDFDKLVEVDKPKLSFKPTLVEYPVYNAGNYQVRCSLTMKNVSEDEDVAQNYNLLTKEVYVNYVIESYEIEATNAITQPRVYVEGDKSVEINEVYFSKLIYPDVFAKGVDWTATGEITDEQYEGGEHNCKCDVTLLNPNYCFEGNTRTYTITGLKVYIIKEYAKKPEASTTEYLYNGEDQTYDVPGVVDIYEVSGNVKKEPGTYTVTYTLCSEVYWEDGSSDPVNLSWTIGKHAEVDLQAGRQITLQKNYTDEVLHEIPLDKKPQDMDIQSESLVVGRGASMLESYSIDNHVIKFKLKSDIEVRDFVLLDVTLVSNRYEIKTIRTRLTVVDKYNAELSGLAVYDKVYDGSSADVDLDNLYVRAINADAYQEDITELVKNDLVYEFYSLDGEEPQLLGSAPKDVGNYKMIAKLKDSSIATGTGSDVNFKITKAAKLSFDDVVDSHCYTDFEPQQDYIYEKDIDLSNIPSGEEYEVGIFSYDDRFGVIDTGNSSISHEGHLTLALIKDYVLPVRTIKVVFAVEPYNYETSYITLTLTFVEKSNLASKGLQLQTNNTMEKSSTMIPIILL